MKLKRLFILSVLCCIISAQLFAQRERGQAPRLEQRFPVYVETINLISAEAGKSRLDITYRIPLNFFIFVKDESSKPEFPFTAKAEISIELLDSNKVSAARELSSRTISTNQPIDIPDPNKFLQGALSFNLVPGIYSMIFEIRDAESDKTYRDNSKIIHLKKFSADSVRASDIILFEAGKSVNSTEYTPINFEGDIPFGQNISCYNELTNRENINPIVVYHISRIAPENRSKSVILVDSLDIGNHAEQLTLVPKSEAFSYQFISAIENTKRSIRFGLKTDSLRQGEYFLELTVRVGGDTITASKDFHVRWFNMPLSLRNIRTAIDALEYIATKDEMRKLQTTDTKAQREAFDDFWAKKDKTQGTIFNEVQEEYYKRVDYAFMNFRTIKEENGVKTDRGKAYIFYGPPTSVSREFSPSSSPKEIWIYKNLSKRFVFTDETSTGDYKLVLKEQL